MPTNNDLGVRQAEAMEAVAQPDIATRREEGFITSKFRDDIAGDGTFNMHVRNPTSDISIDTIRVEFETDFEAVARIYDKFSSAPTNGTELTIKNLLLDENGSQDSGNMSVNQDVTFTADSTHTQTYVSTTSTGANSSGSINAASPIIEPNREIVFELENISGNVGTASMAVIYTEKERIFSREG